MITNTDDSEVMTLNDFTIKTLTLEKKTWNWIKKDSYKVTASMISTKSDTGKVPDVMNAIIGKKACRINYMIAWDLNIDSETRPYDYKKEFGKSFFIVSVGGDSNISFIKNGKHHVKYLKEGVVYDISDFLGKKYISIFIHCEYIIDKKRTIDKESSYDVTILQFCRLKKEHRKTYKIL